MNDTGGRRDGSQRMGGSQTAPTGFPEWGEPMAATLTQDRFTGPEWIFERKFDGIRLLAFRNGPDVRLLSRNGLPPTIPAATDTMANVPVHHVVHARDVIWAGQR